MADWRSVDLLVTGINLSPAEDAGTLYVTYGDAVRLAQASSRVAALIDWPKVERFAVDETRPRREKLPRLPTTFPPRAPCLPTRMSPRAIAALCRKANLPFRETEAFLTVAASLTLTSWDTSTVEECDDAPTDASFVVATAACVAKVALRNDGTVVVWGPGENYHRRDAPTSAGFVAIACGLKCTVALSRRRTWA